MPRLKSLPRQKRLKGADVGKVIKWGFDLTDFKNAIDFQSLLIRHGLTKYAVLSLSPDFPQSHTFVWSNKDGTLKIITGNNPLTGEYSTKSMRKPEVGYASYMGIEGLESKVIRLKDDIKKTATEIKGESQYRRDFI